MKLYSYVLARDYGFAPNPFHGVCTLATCKPKIRETASIGDWIVGTGSKVNCAEDRLVFVMRVTDSMTFCEYYASEEFQVKKPNMRGSLKQAYGDNIYHKDERGIWIQDNSHHSWNDGSTNCNNLEKDTEVDRVLIGAEFAYWGGYGPIIPSNFFCYQCAKDSFVKPYDIRSGRGHKNRFPKDMILCFLQWLESLGQTGYIGEPNKWKYRQLKLKFN